MINDNMTFEEALSALEKAASALRGDNISLEEAMKILKTAQFFTINAGKYSMKQSKK